MTRFCAKCHRTWVASVDFAGNRYICPDCDLKQLRRKYGKTVSIYPRNVTVTLLDGQARAEHIIDCEVIC